MSSEETSSGDARLPEGAVVSDEPVPDFEGRNPIERAEPVLDCPPPGVEVIHLTPEELLTPDTSYLRCAILEEGRPLHDRGGFIEAKRRYEARKDAGEIVFEGGSVCFPQG